MKSKTQLLCCTQSNFTTAHIATSHPQPAQIATSQTSIITNHDLTTAHHSYTVHHIRDKTKIETSQTSIIANCDITPSHHSYSSHSQHWGITKEHHHIHNTEPSQKSIITICDFTTAHHIYTSHTQQDPDWDFTNKHHHKLWFHTRTPYITPASLRLHKWASSQIMSSQLHTIAIHHICNKTQIKISKTSIITYVLWPHTRTP